MSKGNKLIEMVKRAIRAKIPFEYLLVDSWFTCTKHCGFCIQLSQEISSFGYGEDGQYQICH